LDKTSKQFQAVKIRKSNYSQIYSIIVNEMKLAYLAIAGICILLSGCEREDPLRIEFGRKVWVAIEPTQCLTNPWERDWLAQDGNEFADYPMDSQQPGLEAEEYEIIRNYYQKHGVNVFDSATAPKYTTVCKACSCPAGHTMFLLVYERNVEIMVGFGYRLEDPPPAI
jgi:hypothetical protein